MEIEPEYSPYLKYSADLKTVTHHRQIYQTGLVCKGSPISFQTKEAIDWKANKVFYFEVDISECS